VSRPIYNGLSFAGYLELKIKEENSVVACDSAALEVVGDSAQPGITFAYRKDNITSASPPSAAAMMYSYAPQADAAPYNPLVKSPCFTAPDQSTSGYPPVYGDDVTNRMYFSSSVTPSITSLADAYLMQATLPHFHHHQGQAQRRGYGSSQMGSSNSKMADAGQFVANQAGVGGTAGGRDHGVNGSSGHLQLSQHAIAPQSGLIDSSSSVHQFLPSITEFGSVTRHNYC